MALQILPLDSYAPAFRLMGVDGEMYDLASFSKKPILVVVFSCNHCPYVRDYEDRLVSLQRDYSSKGVQLVAINSNDEKAYPEDSFAKMVIRAKEKTFNFPYLRDRDQTTVERYGAVCTPHAFVFNIQRRLKYRGRIDDSRDPLNVKSRDLRNALDDLIAGREVGTPDTKPFGCSIKWSA